MEEEDVNDKDDRPKNWEQQKVTEFFERLEEGPEQDMNNTEQMVLIGRSIRNPTTQSKKEKQTASTGPLRPVQVSETTESGGDSSKSTKDPGEGIYFPIETSGQIGDQGNSAGEFFPVRDRIHGDIGIVRRSMDLPQVRHKGYIGVGGSRTTTESAPRRAWRR